MSRSLILAFASLASACAPEWQKHPTVTAPRHPPSVTEQKLIGTWRITAAVKHHEDGSHEVIEMEPDMEITLTADHKEVWRALNGERRAVARWYLEGDDLVFTLETRSEMGPPGTTRREKIKKITSGELVFTDGTMDGRWKRVR